MWAASAILGLSACSHLRPSSPERIVETATGRTLSCGELAQAVRHSRFALLGEQHDERSHHQRRGALIASLRGSGAVIVAEHLPRRAAAPGEAPQGADVPLQGDLLAALTAGGFRADAWDWPVHEPLFASIAVSGLPLRGGDLPLDVLRGAMKDPTTAPARLQALIDAAPLSSTAEQALDADLIEAHGGKLPAVRLVVMRRAQRLRDASLLAALQDSGGHPAVLVAGNGHVRGDYGVPQLLGATAPGTVVNVALVSPGQPVPGAAHTHSPYTHVWTVDPTIVQRSCDP